MRHLSLMLAGAVLITLARSLGKRGKTDGQKHLRTASLLLGGLVLILIGIPRWF